MPCLVGMIFSGQIKVRWSERLPILETWKASVRANLLFSVQAPHVVSVETETQRGEETFLSYLARSGEAGKEPISSST